LRRSAAAENANDGSLMPAAGERLGDGEGLLARVSATR
jgi:hypothetical protein